MAEEIFAMTPLEKYRLLRSLAHECGVSVERFPENPDPRDLTELRFQLNIASLQGFTRSTAYSVSEGDAGHKQKLPEGFWYFYTLTQPKGKSEQDMRQLHESSLRFFTSRGISPYLVSLEKSSIYHTHGLIRCKSYAKNLARDLSRHCNGYRTHVSHKISSAKEFNRVMNYIRKQGYDNDQTNLEILLENKI